MWTDFLLPFVLPCEDAAALYISVTEPVTLHSSRGADEKVESKDQHQRLVAGMGIKMPRLSLIPISGNIFWIWHCWPPLLGFSCTLTSHLLACGLCFLHLLWKAQGVPIHDKICMDLKTLHGTRAFIKKPALYTTPLGPTRAVPTCPIQLKRACHGEGLFSLFAPQPPEPRNSRVLGGTFEH